MSRQPDVGGNCDLRLLVTGLVVLVVLVVVVVIVVDLVVTLSGLACCVGLLISLNLSVNRSDRDFGANGCVSVPPGGDGPTSAVATTPLEPGNHRH